MTWGSLRLCSLGVTREGCHLNFAETYGERCEGFMEVHHTRPVREIRPDHVTRLAGLALPSDDPCTAATLTIEELRALVAP